MLLILIVGSDIDSDIDSDSDSDIDNDINSDIDSDIDNVLFNNCSLIINLISFYHHYKNLKLSVKFR